MRSLLTALLLLSFALAAHAADWPGVPYTEVRAYAWPLDLNEEEVILAGDEGPSRRAEKLRGASSRRIKPRACSRRSNAR